MNVLNSRNSLNVLLRYHVQKNGPDVRTNMDEQPENIVPMATAVAAEFQLHFGFRKEVK